MRNLTQQEIADTPHWATHYDVCEASLVPNYTCYYGDDCSQWKYHISGAWSPKMHRVGPRPDTARSISRGLDINAKFREDVRKLALANGFKYKRQPDGTMDLNPYVFEFARALLTAEDLK